VAGAIGQLHFEQVNVSGDANDFEAMLLGYAKRARPGDVPVAVEI
jgi:hypothetical protein